LSHRTPLGANFIPFWGPGLLLPVCAQPGPPLPPSLELPKPPGDLHATRKGDKVTLTWTQPTRTTDRQSLRYLGPTRICRGQGNMTECATPVAQLPPGGAQPEAEKPVYRLFVDTLPAQLQNPSTEITYAVEVM